MDNAFYLAFENKYRGSRELVSSRLDAYLPFILPVREVIAEPRALDLGCGRGEWLEKLQVLGFKATGIDINHEMQAFCASKGLSVVDTHALDFLRETPDDSIAVISGFHLVEHLEFDDVLDIARESLRALIPGGLLIFETPNPENFRVGSCDFYLDPTHMRPIPPLLLSFVSDYSGFERSLILRLQQCDHLDSVEKPSLLDVLVGTSRDYAVVAQKGGDQILMDRLNAAYSSSGVASTEEIVEMYDAGMLYRYSTNAADGSNLLPELAAADLKISLEKERSHVFSFSRILLGKLGHFRSHCNTSLMPSIYGPVKKTARVTLNRVGSYLLGKPALKLAISRGLNALGLKNKFAQLLLHRQPHALDAPPSETSRCDWRGIYCMDKTVSYASLGPNHDAILNLLHGEVSSSGYNP